MRGTFAGAVFLAFLGTVTAASAFPNEPGGFRNIPWGAPFANYASEMSQVETDGRQVFYRRKGDNMSIGDAKMSSVVYIFYKGQFAGAMLDGEAASKFPMIDAFNAQFGYGDKPNQFMDRYFWTGDTAQISLDCNAVTDVCTAIIQSRYFDQMRQADDKAAAAQSGKDF